MKIEDQVCSIEQAKRLVELGISQNAYFSWVGDESHTVVDPGNEAKNIPMRFGKYVWVDTTDPANSQESDHRQDIALKTIASAFTAAELGEMLTMPRIDGYYNMSCNFSYAHNNWSCLIESMDEEGPDLICISANMEAECKADILIWLLENNYTSSEECNNRLMA